jgi:predicted phosphodiesterase
MSSKTALLSDIHGNSPALRAVLEDIQREGCTQAFVLGDIVNGIDPRGCIRLLQAWGGSNGVDLSGLKGNGEATLAIPDRAGLPLGGRMWGAELLDLLQWWQDRLPASDMEWIRSLPEVIRRGEAYLVHDSPLDRLVVQSRTRVPPGQREWMFHGRGIRPDMAEQDWEELIEYLRAEDIRQVFCGHTHRPFLKEIDGRLICNVGSAGMPLDGDPRPSWVLLAESDSGERTISIRRVAYDISALVQLIDQTPDYPDFRKPGYQESYKNMFLSGTPYR